MTEKNAERLALEEKAKSLGIAITANMKDETIAAKIEAAESGQDDAPKKSVPSVTVKGPEKGRRRIGRSFGAKAEIIPLSDLNKGDLEALKADPQLMVVVSGAD
ncbi:MAG: hypothetical protein EP318_06260 [Rhodobacteraceae bacterium]|nr:MAG: hypothetical protein EP318_06260 [Paracoccaceae bacterium]